MYAVDFARLPAQASLGHHQVAAPLAALTVVLVGLAVGCQKPAEVESKLQPVAIKGTVPEAVGDMSLTTTGSPSITGVFPSEAEAGSTITIAGVGFASDIASNVITFGAGATASPDTADSDSLTVTVPQTAQSGLLSVAVDGVGSNRFYFKVAVPPSPSLTLSALQPNPGATGSVISLTGTGFSTTAADNVVTFADGATASPTTADANSLVVTVPANATSGLVSVTTGSKTSNRLYLTIAAGPLPGPAIAAVFPDRGTIGQEVTISGSSFGTATGSVTLGGLTAPIRSWSASEIVFTIPSYAQSGPLSVVTSDGAEGSRPGFSVLAGIPDAGYNAFPRMAASHTTGWIGRTKHYLYVAGGLQGAYPQSSAHTSVEKASIATDGNVSSFSTVSGVTLTQSVSYPAFIPDQIGPYMYIFGGSSASQTGLAVIQRATVNSDETLSTFSNAPVSLAKPTLSAYAVRVKDYIYVIGGQNSTDGYLNVVQKALINSDGTLGNFTYTSNALTFTAYQGVPVQVGNYLYVFGGGISASTTTIQRALIDANGNLGTFYNYGNLPVPFYGGGAVVIGNVLYLVYGLNASDWVNSVYRISFTPEGDLGPAFLHASLTYAHQRAFPIVVGNRMILNSSMNAASVSGLCCWATGANSQIIETILLR